MPEGTKYLVRVCADTAFLAVVGKAGYLNCRNAERFFVSSIDGGCSRIVVQLRDCTGMDSTFLGIIAGAALRLKKRGGELVLLNPNERNAELVENLGISKLVKIDGGAAAENPCQELESSSATKSEILGAHQNLVDADASNLAKFEDVISFLKKETEKK